MDSPLPKTKPPLDVDAVTLPLGQPPGEVTLPPDVAESASSQPRMKPRTFGDYELLDEIARGGMGIVYKARQCKLNRVVALKMILGGQLASSEDIQRFYTEAEAAAGLDHPGIVPIYEVGELDGQHFFSMAYVEGKSLAERIAAAPIDPREAAALMKQLAEAVAYAHSNGVLHRDLKPANILLNEPSSRRKGDPSSSAGSSVRPILQGKITDFGLAKRLDGTKELTNTGQILGTPNYMPPEQAAGKIHEIKETADIYSLGAILYAMLTGHPPFQANSPLDVLVQVLESEPTLPSQQCRGIPRELEWICLRCLEKQPARRYPSAEELAADLDRFLKGESVTARPAGVVQKLQRWTRKEPSLAAHFGALAAALLITNVKFALDYSDPAYHARVCGLLLLWGVVSFIGQQLLNRERTAELGRYLWTGLDVVLLTALLATVLPPRGSLMIAYPLLIAAAGLFFRVRLVLFTTCATMIGYPVLLAVRAEEARPLHYAIIFEAILAILGLIVAHQVQRVRALSRYYDHRELP